MTLPQRFYHRLVPYCGNAIVWDNITGVSGWQYIDCGTCRFVIRASCFPFTSILPFVYAPCFCGVNEYTQASPLSSFSSGQLLSRMLYTHRWCWFLDCWFVRRPFMHFRSKLSLAPQLLLVFPYAGHICSWERDACRSIDTHA